MAEAGGDLGASPEKRAGKLKGIAFLLVGLLVGGILGALVLLGGPAGNASGSRRLPPTVGSPVKDFQLDTLDGSTLRLSDLQGKSVVINFWATWCAPCKEEMPLLNQYAEKYAGQMTVLGVNFGETEEQIEGFLVETPVTFPILLDATNAVTDDYYVRSFPMTFFVDAEGVLRAQHLGMLSEALLARYLKTIGIEP